MNDTKLPNDPAQERFEAIMEAVIAYGTSCAGYAIDHDTDTAALRRSAAYTRVFDLVDSAMSHAEQSRDDGILVQTEPCEVVGGGTCAAAGPVTHTQGCRNRGKWPSQEHKRRYLTVMAENGQTIQANDDACPCTLADCEHCGRG